MIACEQPALFVQAFINAEDQNFSLFNYVNDLSSDIERVEDSIAQVSRQISECKGQGTSCLCGPNNLCHRPLISAAGPSPDHQRKQMLEDLEGKLSKTEGKASYYEEKYQAVIRLA